MTEPVGLAKEEFVAGGVEGAPETKVDCPDGFNTRNRQTHLRSGCKSLTPVLDLQESS